MENLKELLALLQIEKEEELSQYTHNVEQCTIPERKNMGLTWYPVVITHSEIATGGNLYANIERTTQLGQPSQFQSGSMVSVFLNKADNKQTFSIQGTIAAIWQDSMKVAFNTDELPDWIDDGKLGVNLLFDNASFKEMENALQTVIKADKNRLAELREVISGNLAPQYDRTVHVPELPYLNVSQNEALKNVLQAKDIAIVHGPPGTGKTTTLVQAIRLTLANEKQVLVTAPSNTATDLLTEKLAAEGLKVVRIGNPARVTPTLLKYSLDEQITTHPDFKNAKKWLRDAEEYRRLANKYKRSFGADEREQRKLLIDESKKLRADALNQEKYIVNSILSEAQVITATLVGCTKISSQTVFSTVFIDEAGQALAPATWIPITKAKKVVLAGDHYQLPPTVKSAEAARKGLAITLLEQAVARTNAQTMLTTQYRMNELIMNFSSQQFYNGKLEAHESVANQILFNDHNADNNNLYNQPVEFIDTAGCGFDEEQTADSPSLFNTQEANTLIKHLTEIFENTTLATMPNAVGIISPYKAQVAFLRELVTEKGWTNVEVNTIDSFQGQEKEVIYISLVRSNTDQKIGFLEDTRRMNVALTRAKKKLVIVGDSATIAVHPFYNHFIDYIHQIQAYRSAWELV